MIYENGGIYHVYNRGVNKQTVFTDKDCFTYFLKLLNHAQRFNTAPTHHSQKVAAYGVDSFLLLDNSADLNLRDLENRGHGNGSALKKSIPIKLHAYCLMPNHFHFLLEQLVDGGISFYVRRVLTSYSKTFNSRFNRTGPLWEGRFKAKQIEDDYSYLQVIRYIHLNPFHSGKTQVEDLSAYPYSSYHEAVGQPRRKIFPICDHKFLRGLIPATSQYKEFVQAEISLRAQKVLENLIIETPFDE